MNLLVDNYIWTKPVRVSAPEIGETLETHGEWTQSK